MLMILALVHNPWQLLPASFTIVLLLGKETSEEQPC